MLNKLSGLVKNIKLILALIQAVKRLLPLLDAAWAANELVFKEMAKIYRQHSKTLTENEKLDIAAQEIRRLKPEVKGKKVKRSEARAASEVALMLQKRGFKLQG